MVVRVCFLCRVSCQGILSALEANGENYQRALTKKMYRFDLSLIGARLCTETLFYAIYLT